MTGTTVAHTDTKKVVICNWYNRVEVLLSYSWKKQINYVFPTCLQISASFSMCEIGSQVCVCMTVYKAQVQVS